MDQEKDTNVVIQEFNDKIYVYLAKKYSGKDIYLAVNGVVYQISPTPKINQS